jgi:NitT/TauT family transport system substrate-binding protein
MSNVELARAVGLSRTAFFGLSAAYAASFALPAQAADAPMAVTVAATPNDTFAEGYYAADMGFFTKAGLDATVTTMPNGGAVASAVAGGAIDIGITNPLTLAGAASRGVRLKFICAGGGYNPKATVLCVGTSATMRTARDFTGATIAVSSIRGSEWLAVQAWLDQNGGDSKSVKFVELPFSEIGPALARGTVAGGTITEPSLTAAKASVRVVAPVFDVFGPQVMIGGWFTTEKVIQTKPEAVRRFVEAIYASARWANAHQDLSGAILGKYAKLEMETIRSMNRTPYPTSLTTVMLQPEYDIAYKYGLFTSPVAAADVIAH